MRNFLIITGLFVFVFPGSAPWAAESLEWVIEGAPEELEGNMELHLQGIGDLNGRTREQLVPALERAVIRAGRALGYYELTYEWEREDNRITIQVTPGEPVRWHTTDLSLQGQGETETELVFMRQNHPFKTGEAINQGVYEDYKSRWLNQARSLGYRDARYTQSALKLNLGEKSAHVILSLQTGEPFFVERVTFEGSRIHRDLLRRLSLINPGDRYRAAELAKLYGQLLDTGYFEQISVKPEKVAPGQIAIKVLLVDSALHTFTTGVGFSTDTGPRVRMGWDMPLITEYGHQWHSEARVSELEQRVSSEYRIPISNPLNHYLAADVGWRHKDVEDTETRTWETSFSHHSMHSGWQHTYKVSLEDEKYRQGEEPTKEVFYVIPGASWSRTRLRGDPNLPDGGYRVWLLLEASTVALGSDTDFARVVTGARGFTLVGERHEFHLKLELGMVEAGQYEDVPPSRRFFTGGDQTVRGYDFESISPRDEDDNLIGGRYLNVVGAEYRWRWKPSWFLALFTDAGRAYNENSARFRKGAGFGLHWQSPVGPVRFDIASPVEDDENNGVRLHLTMGTVF